MLKLTDENDKSKRILDYSGLGRRWPDRSSITIINEYYQSAGDHPKKSGNRVRNKLYFESYISGLARLSILRQQPWGGNSDYGGGGARRH